MRRKKGPCRDDEWAEALEGSLTGEKAEYLKRGKLCKCDYNTLLKRINDCVIDNLNSALKLFENGSEELTEGIYRLEFLTHTLRNVCFFRELDFIKKKDCEDISGRVKAAMESFVSQIEIPVENENADLIFHLRELKRTAGIA